MLSKEFKIGFIPKKLPREIVSRVSFYKVRISKSAGEAPMSREQMFRTMLAERAEIPPGRFFENNLLTK